jgi:hypothetical protein
MQHRDTVAVIGGWEQDGANVEVGHGEELREGPNPVFEHRQFAIDEERRGITNRLGICG